MPDVTETTQSQGVRAFVSFDLVGSAAIKSSALASFPQGPRAAGSLLGPLWLSFFLDLFRKIHETFRDQLAREFERLGDPQKFRKEDRIERFRVEIWRITGDEVLFVSQRLTNAHQLALLARVVSKVLEDIDANYLASPKARAVGEVGLKAVLWAAGFPIRNTEFLLLPQTSPAIRPQNWTAHEAQNDSLSDDAPFGDGGIRMVEFLGPEIDLGFRLAALASPRRLLVSFDVAELIARTQGRGHDEKFLPNFHHVGWSVLKGLYGEKPYPLIWLDYGNAPPAPRRSYEATRSPYAQRYLEGSQINTRSLISLAEQYLKDTSETRIQMYIDPTPPPEHKKLYDDTFNEMGKNA